MKQTCERVRSRIESLISFLTPTHFDDSQKGDHVQWNGIDHVKALRYASKRLVASCSPSVDTLGRKQL